MAAPSTTNAPTAWGDAEARRRDILEAAAALLEAGGYPALTMRAVADGAGVSPGTIYHHFADKEQVVAALMEQRLEALGTTIVGLRAAGVRAVLRAIVPQTTELWRCLGRTSVGWGRDLLGPERDVHRTPEPADRAWHAMLDALGVAMAAAAAHEGRRLLGGAAAVPFVWAGLMGLADDLVNEWSAQAGLPEDELVDFTVDALARGVTDSIDGGAR